MEIRSENMTHASSASLDEEREREVDRIIREVQVLKCILQRLAYFQVHLSLPVVALLKSGAYRFSSNRITISYLNFGKTELHFLLCFFLMETNFMQKCII